MKRFLTTALAISAALLLTACGPEDAPPINSGDTPVTMPTSDAAAPTLPLISSEDTTETLPTLTEPVTEPSESESQESSSESSITVATSSEAAVTTKSTSGTTITTTTASATKKTETAATTTEAPAEEEEEENVYEDIPNMDEFWASLGLEDDGFNAGDR